MDGLSIVSRTRGDPSLCSRGVGGSKLYFYIKVTKCDQVCTSILIIGYPSTGQSLLPVYLATSIAQVYKLIWGH